MMSGKGFAWPPRQTITPSDGPTVTSRMTFPAVPHDHSTVTSLRDLVRWFDDAIGDGHCTPSFKPANVCVWGAEPRLCVGANPYIGSRRVFDDRQALAGRPGSDLST